MNNEISDHDFIEELKQRGFNDVTISTIFRDEEPKAILRFTHNHELELCFYNFLSNGKDFIRIFPKNLKTKVLAQIDFSLKRDEKIVWYVK